jgi:hydroxyethylthiazole kinase
MTSIDEVFSALEDLRARRPLVHNITNYVGKSVDSTASANDAVGAATALAKRTGAVVAVTGAIDYVCDGETPVAIETGHALMPLSTALGCSLSAVTAAFAAVRPPREAAIAALAVFGAAGAAAGERARGPGHLPAEICDELYRMDAPRCRALRSLVLEPARVT